MFFVLFRYRNQTVAIKIIKRGESPEEIAKRDNRFAREIAMLSKVQHKNLVKVFQFFLSTNSVHLANQRVLGCNQQRLVICIVHWSVQRTHDGYSY